ncbi:MAG TPA: HAMP domain-containing sensor histidine kinase, partial [Candidatus Binatia bacterium]|nr:HAMP domain-containing sensor histidine kinase [Candidatus Binatia bacterium]
FADHFAFFLAMRLACVAVLGLLLLLIRRPFGERHGAGLGVAVTLVAGGMVDAMTMKTGGHASPYYAGISLVILAMAVIMPWRPVWAAAACSVLVGGYVAGSFAAGPITHPAIFVNNLFFLATTAVIAVVGTSVRETLRRRDFWSRHALRRALRHKDDFMAKMTHELRTPLHVMIGYADILLEDGLAQGEREARPLVERIRGQGVLLHRLVSDLLDYAKAEAGKMEVRAEPVPMRQVVDEVTESFRPLSERKGLRLRAIHHDAPATVVSDGRKIAQILTNLVGNALKFTDRGGITIEVRGALDPDDGTLAGLVFLGEPPAEVPSDGEGVVLLVRDTGIGIRDADLRTLAADFRQLDPEAAARYGGTGLGLSISKRLARLLGGWIAVHSAHRRGSTFVVFVPSRAEGEAGRPRTAA